MAAERNPNGTFKKGSGLLKKGDKIALKYTDEYGDKLVELFREMLRNGEVPTFQGAAVALGVHERTMETWAKEHPYFADKYAECVEMQKQDIIAGALTERYNPRFAQFFLAVVYGMCEKSKLEVAGDKNAPIEINIVTDG